MQIFRISAVVIMVFTFAVSAFSETVINPEHGLILSNDHVRFEFEPGGMGLSAMIDRASGTNHIKDVEGKHLLWEVAFGVGRQIYTITNNYRPCNYAYTLNLPDGGQRAVMEWNEARWWIEDSVVTVQVIIDLPKDDGIAKWRIFVENLSDYWGLWSVQFPLVNGFPSSGEYDIARPTFASGGTLLKNWTERINGRYPGGGWPMQFMSFNKGNNAVYFASMDPDARGKDFVAEPVVQGTTNRYPVVYEGRRHKSFVPEPGEKVYLTHYVEDMGMQGSDYPDHYPVEFGVYQGGWVEAALRYREWALKQKWAQKGPISQRQDIPDIVKDIGLWVRDGWKWNDADGTPHEMNLPLIEVQKKMGVPMGIHWYRWHHMPFDNLYPHFLPPNPGFDERVKELVDQDLLIIPYINGSSADMNIHDWEDFKPHAIMDEAGGLRHHFYSDRSGRLLSMCPTQEFWQDAISVLVDSLLGYHGCNGVYIDQISALYHELCFDPDHGHALGGGSWWADGSRDLMRKVFNVSHKKGRRDVITSEGANEIFFDLLDANLTWAEPSDREIPMMFVVYSGYSIFFGSRCDYRRSNRFFNFAQGQAFIDGRQNGWMDFRLFNPEFSEKADYFKQCGQYRVATKKFLTYGRLWGPVLPENSVPTFSEEGFGWGLYGAQRTASVPSTEARLWQSEDGNLGLFIANYVNEEIPFSYSIDPAKYGLKKGSYKLTEITPEGTHTFTTVYGTIERTENVGPGKIKVIEIAPANP